MNELKKLLLAGVGLTSLSIEKVEQVIKSLTEKGELTMQEGKDLQAKLSQKLSAKTEPLKEKLTARSSVSSESFEALSDRVNFLEETLESLTGKALEEILNAKASDKNETNEADGETKESGTN